MKAVVAAFNQEKALVGVFSVITNLQMDLFEALLNMPHIAALSCNFYGNFTFLWICWTLQNCAELNREKKPQVPGAGRGAVAAGGSKSLLRAGFQSKYMFQIFSIQTHLNLHIFEFDLNNALNYCQ